MIGCRSDIKDAIAQRIIWCFWTGDNKMSDQRRRCLDSMEETTGCNVVLVTKAMLGDFLCLDHPLHAAYPQLSRTHMTDYLRAYSHVPLRRRVLGYQDANGVMG